VTVGLADPPGLTYYYYNANWRGWAGP
jgi:hypothetical protein